MDYQKILSRLCVVPAPSGFEGAMADTAEELLRPLVDEVRRDRLGNVTGVLRCGRENAPRILLDAHMDQVGYIVTGHENGFLRFAALGGVDPRMLPGREMLVLTDPPIPGLVACLPPQMENRAEMDRAIPIQELFLDVGLPQEEAESRIPVGTPFICRPDCFPLGKEFLCGTALDDRAGFAVLLDTLEQLKGETLDMDLYVLGAVQEERYEEGAMVASYAIIPDVCVAVDVTHGDSPDAARDLTFPLGKGPVLGAGPNCTRWLLNRMRDTARSLNMDVQTEVSPGHSGTDAWPVQVSREGVATSVLSVPLRYMHTPLEVVRRSDMEDCARLLTAFLRKIGKELPRG